MGPLSSHIRLMVKDEENILIFGAAQLSFDPQYWIETDNRGMLH